MSFRTVRAICMLLLIALLGAAGRAQAWGGPLLPQAIGAVRAGGTAHLVHLSSTVVPPSVYAQTPGEDFAQQVVEEINRARWENGRLPPLKRQEGLDAAAAYHSQDMAVDDYFAHDSYNRVNGQLKLERYWWQRVGEYYPGWSALGECIAAGFITPQSVVEAWLNSPDHRAILLGSDYREIGSGYYAGGGTYGTYWTTDFGSRFGIYPLVIDREAASTDRRDVTLYIYGEGWATQMRFRNEEGDWSEWEPYEPDREWTLSCGTGLKTVHVELRSGGEVRSTSDTIWLEGEEHRLAVEPTGEVVFLYGIDAGEMTPAPAWTFSVGDEGVGCGGLNWEAHWDAEWLAVSPVTGTTPATVTITPTGFSADTPGEYAGTVTFTAVLGADTEVPSSSIPVRLLVVEQVSRAFLPLTMRDR